MSIPDFRSSADDDVGGCADVGRGKLTLVSDNRSFMPLARMACRDSWGSLLGEQHLLNQVLAAVEASGYPLSRALIVNYYVSLKTNPFVILTGPEGQGKTGRFSFVQPAAFSAAQGRHPGPAVDPFAKKPIGIGESARGSGRCRGKDQERCSAVAGL